jgi:adenylate kinase
VVGLAEGGGAREERAICSRTRARPVAQVPGKDDITGEPLMKRKDDNEATLRSRLTAFHEQTKPVVDYYAAKGLYSPIDANQKFDTVKAAIAAVLSK